MLYSVCISLTKIVSCYFCLTSNFLLLHGILLYWFNRQPSSLSVSHRFILPSSLSIFFFVRFKFPFPKLEILSIYFRFQFIQVVIVQSKLDDMLFTLKVNLSVSFYLRVFVMLMCHLVLNELFKLLKFLRVFEGYGVIFIIKGLVIVIKHRLKLCF